MRLLYYSYIICAAFYELLLSCFYFYFFSAFIFTFLKSHFANRSGAMHTFFALRKLSFFAFYTNSLARTNTHTHTRTNISLYMRLCANTSVYWFSQILLSMLLLLLLLLMLSRLLLLHLFLHFVHSWLLYCCAPGRYSCCLTAAMTFFIARCCCYCCCCYCFFLLLKLSPSSLGIISKGIPLSIPYRCACPIYSYRQIHGQSKQTALHICRFVHMYIYICTSRTMLLYT